MDKTRQISQVFEELQVGQNELISKEQLLRFLDRKTPSGIFDREVFSQLYDRMRKGLNGYITINDFIEVMMQARDVLKSKMEGCRVEISSRQSLLNEYNKKLSTLNERMNEYNISSESLINVRIMECEVLFPGSTSIFFKLKCDNQIVQSNMSSRNSPYWNQEFEFQVRHGSEQIQIVLLDEDLRNMQEMGGFVSLDVSRFGDQLVHDMWVDMFDRSGVVLRSRVHLVVQWIHSKSLYLQGLISDTQLMINEQNMDIEDYRKDIETIFSPFYYNMQSVNDETQERTNDLVQQQSTTSVDIHYKYVKRVTMVYLALAILACLDKTIFLDFIVIFSSELIFIKNNQIKPSLLVYFRLIGIALIVTVFYDLVWLCIFGSAWVSKDRVRFFELEDWLHRYEVIVSILLLLVKCILSFLYYQIHSEYPSNSSASILSY